MAKQQQQQQQQIQQSQVQQNQMQQFTSTRALIPSPPATTSGGGVFAIPTPTVPSSSSPNALFPFSGTLSGAVVVDAIPLAPTITTNTITAINSNPINIHNSTTTMITPHQPQFPGIPNIQILAQMQQGNAFDNNNIATTTSSSLKTQDGLHLPPSASGSGSGSVPSMGCPGPSFFQPSLSFADESFHAPASGVWNGGMYVFQQQQQQQQQQQEQEQEQEQQHQWPKI
jgi:hypothetical protein